MLFGSQDQNSKNGNLNKSNLQIIASPHKNSSTILQRARNNNTQFHMEKQKFQDSQNHKGTSRGIHNP